jgi:hypothetical protein
MEQILTLFKQLTELGVSPVLLNLLAAIILVYVIDIKIVPIIKRIIYQSTMTRQSNKGIKIIDLLKQYQELMLCDRIGVFEFHNTTHNIYGKSFMKFTCTHEVTRLGVDSYNLGLKDLPISSYKEILKLISTNDSIIVSHIDETKLTSEFVNCCKKGLVQSIVLVPINYRGSLYGFMTIEFTRSDNFGGIDVDDIIKHAYTLMGEIAATVCKGK